MSKESKKLAKNVLDDGSWEFPMAPILAIAVAVAAITAYVYGIFPTSDADFIPDINITEQLKTGLTTPIEESEEETLKTLLTTTSEVVTVDNTKLRLHPSASYYCFPDEDNETIVSLMKEYDSCIRYTNTEMNGDYYTSFKYMIEECPSLKPEATARLKTQGMLTYIDNIELEIKCNNLNADKVKANMLQDAADVKAELLK